MHNLLEPAILFFVFGVLARLVKSDLEIPQPVSRFLALYLLMALGLKGGFALAHSGVTGQVATSLGCAVGLAVVVPMIGYCLLRRFLPAFDAAAVAATYGSVSAVTFVTAVQTLESQQVPFGGYMAAAMALMESPAIIFAVLMANSLRRSGRPAPLANRPDAPMPATLGQTPTGVSIGTILHESLTNGTQLMLLGAMVVGILSGDAGKAAMQPFTSDIFKGMLAFFLLDMGLLTASSLPQLRGRSPWLIAYAILAPWCHAALALMLAIVFHLATGDAALLMVLAASASYIAVPAVLRYAIPEAEVSLYIGLSLGVTFPMNMLFGIPVYLRVAQHFIS